VIIAVPFIVGAPHLAGPAFLHPDATVVEILTSLHHKFIIGSSIANFVFWLVLGGMSAVMLNRFVLPNDETNEINETK
jgi:predicted cobalt transporter CbtA